MLNFFRNQDEIIESSNEKLQYNADEYQRTYCGGVATFIVKLGLIYIALTRGH